MRDIPEDLYEEDVIDPALLRDDALWRFRHFISPNAHPPGNVPIDPRLEFAGHHHSDFQPGPDEKRLERHTLSSGSSRPKSGLSSYALSLLCHDIPLSPHSQALAAQYGSSLSGLPLDPRRGTQRQSEAIERTQGGLGVPQAQRELLQHVHTLPSDQFAHLHQSINRYAPALHGRWSLDGDDVFGASAAEFSAERKQSFTTPKKRESITSLESTPTKKRRESLGAAIYEQTEEQTGTDLNRAPVLTLASLQNFGRAPSSRGSPAGSSVIYSSMSGGKIKKPETQLRIKSETSCSPQDRKIYRKRVRAASSARSETLTESGTVNSLQTFATPATVDISRIDFEVTAEELLTFFPQHTRWPHYMYRLVQNGWEISNIAGFINMVRSLDPPEAIKRNSVGKHLANADKELIGKKVGSRTKKRSEEMVEDFTPGVWSSPDLRGGLEDYFIASLAQGVVIFPTSDGARLLTKTILHARDKGHEDARLSQISNYIREQGLYEEFPDMMTGEKNEDHIALGRHMKAILRDEERVKQLAESKLAEAVSKGGDGRGLRSYLPRRSNKVPGVAAEVDGVKSDEAIMSEQ